MYPAARGFETSGERYERGRPDYPEEAIDLLLAELGRPARVLDVGAGTGKLTRPLLARRLEVIAVEPAAAMRETLERTAPGATVHAAQADALPLEDGAVDAVVAGQAFHWFATAAALAEFARVLAPGGRLGLVWNRRDLGQPLQRTLGALMAPYRREAPDYASDAWRAAFTDTAPFALAAEHRIPSVQRLDADGLADRVLSISFMAALPAHERDAVEARVRELAAEPVELRYRTELFVYAQPIRTP
jgi:SAM-dependent methyltransferase